MPIYNRYIIGKVRMTMSGIISKSRFQCPHIWSHLLCHSLTLKHLLLPEIMLSLEFGPDSRRLIKLHMQKISVQKFFIILRLTSMSSTHFLSRLDINIFYKFSIVTMWPLKGRRSIETLECD